MYTFINVRCACLYCECIQHRFCIYVFLFITFLIIRFLISGWCVLCLIILSITFASGLSMDFKQISVRLPVEVVQRIEQEEGNNFTIKLLNALGYDSEILKPKLQVVIQDKLKELEQRIQDLESCNGGAPNASENPPAIAPVKHPKPSIKPVDTNIKPPVLEPISGVISYNDYKEEINRFILELNTNHNLGKKKISDLLISYKWQAAKGGGFTISCVSKILHNLKTA